ncbi:MAG: ATP-dependent dethiobiotin synthetase BioD [Acidimicrobiia bacterium]
MRTRRALLVTGGAPTGNRARPRVLVLVTGTGTDVGKTWWTAAVARGLRSAGMRVSARKPVQSGAPGDPTDAAALAAASGEPEDEVTPPHRTLAVPWAPPMAADELGLPPFTVADLVRETEWHDDVDIGLVEGVGGPRSPLAADGDTVTLASALSPDVVVVVGDAGLGAVNAVRLSVGVLAGHPVVVALNRFGAEPLHERNLASLRGDGLTVVTTPAELVTMLIERTGP